MVAKVSKKKGESYPPEASEAESGEQPISLKTDEYTHSIKKIASYSGVTRIMKCDGKCGKFDEIVNIYVHPKGIRENEYKDPSNKIIDKFDDEHTISKKNVKNDNVAYRHKKRSKPMRRMTVPKRGNKRKGK